MPASKPSGLNAHKGVLRGVRDRFRPSDFPGLGRSDGGRPVTLNSYGFPWEWGGGRMTGERISRWADLLVDYCLGSSLGRTILIASELEARPLVEACLRRSSAGGRTRSYGRAARPGRVLPRARDRGPARPPLARLAPRGRGVRRPDPDLGRDRHPLDAPASTRSGRRSSTAPATRSASGRQKRWVLTQFPTAAYAADAEMPLEDYEAFVASAMFLDRPDPVAAWQELGRRQAGLVEFMTGVRRSGSRRRGPT